MLKVTGCCCFDLENGGKILGWLGIIGSILLLIGHVNNGVIIENCLQHSSEPTYNKICSNVNNIDANVNTLRIVMRIISFVVYSMLLCGIYNRNQILIIPALYATFVRVVLELIVLIFVLIKIDNFYAVDAAFIIIAFFVDACLSCYFFVVLHSLYDKILLEKEPPRYSFI